VSRPRQRRRDWQQAHPGRQSLRGDAQEGSHRIPFVAVLAPQHRFASQPSIALGSLVNEPFILCQRQSASVLYDRIIQLCGFSPRITQEVSDIRMVLGLVAANLGVSLVPASAMPLRTEGIIYRPLADRVAEIAVETALVWRRNGLSPVVQEFLAVAREVLSQLSKTMMRAQERTFWERCERRASSVFAVMSSPTMSFCHVLVKMVPL